SAKRQTLSVGGLAARSPPPERRRPLNSCSARKRSFEISRSIPSSEDAQRNKPYRRKGVARTTRTRPHQNMTPPSFGFLKTLQQRPGQSQNPPAMFRSSDRSLSV